MIGKPFTAPANNVTGKVAKTTTMPDGKVIARIKDHWLFADDLVPA